MTTMNTIVVPCMVNSELYVSGLTIDRFGAVSCARMMSDSIPPRMEKASAVKPYRSPIRLWSTVVSQLHTPEGWTGRGSTPMFASATMPASLCVPRFHYRAGPAANPLGHPQALEVRHGVCHLRLA